MNAVLARTRSLLAVLGLLLFAVTAATTFAQPAAPAPVDEPVVSALVGIKGPSVFRRLEAMHVLSRYDGSALAMPTSHRGTVIGELASADVKDRPDVGGNSLPRRLETEVRLGQQPVVDAAGRLGIRVISRYTTVANGLLVHATARQLAALAAVSGVEYVEPAPLLKPQLANSVPWIGAARLWKDLGYDGKDTTVAIVDTGVDYTHMHLGGPGTVDGWNAANLPGMTEVITDTYEGKLLYPNQKVVGGWDFVGPRYDPPHICTPARMATGTCTNIPEPDADPLDGGGHGTHVGGIVAGNHDPQIGDGVAPGATLVGLKLYGKGGADEAADVVVDAFEWCAKVNLGTETRGVLPKRVDAVNISLGEDYSQGSRMFNESVEAAAGVGVMIASSAGNAGNIPFVHGAPSASPKILAVASSLPPATVLMVDARWEGGQDTYPAVESSMGRTLKEVGRLESDLAWFGRGCNTDAPIQDVKEKVALIERGVCVFAEKLLNAQKAGAVAAVIYSDDRPKQSAGGDGTGITIPSVMVDKAPGLELRTKLEGDIKVTVVLDGTNTRYDTASADTISGFSSRGPSKNGALKPDITGPGSGIVSAAMGSGASGVSFSGTSMSGPHLAGALALMHHRNRAEKLGLTALDLAALLTNFARPVVFNTASGIKVTVPVVRQGAGEVDLWRAGNGKFVVRSGDIASINLSMMALAAPARVTRQMTVRNLGDNHMFITVTGGTLYPDDRDRGLTLTLPNEPIEVPAKGTADISVVFNLDPAKLSRWTLWPDATADAAEVNTLEIDGYLNLRETGYRGQYLPDAIDANVPFYVLPRAASAIEAGAHTDTGAVAPHLHLDNQSANAGHAEIFLAPPIKGPETPIIDPDERDVAHELDVRGVGVRFETSSQQVPMLSFAVATYETAAVPQVLSNEIYVDTNRDGAPDFRVRDGLIGGGGQSMKTFVGGWDAESGRLVGADAITGTTHATDAHAYLSLLSVPLAMLGMNGPAPFDFYVVRRGLNEDWLHGPNTDVAPDGANLRGGPVYAVDPASWSLVPAQWSADVAGLSEADIGLQIGPGKVPPSWWVLMSTNGLDRPAAQAQLVGAEAPGPHPGEHRIVLPWLARGAGGE